MRKISVSVDSLGRVTADSTFLGYSGEHNAVTLAVDLSSGLNEGFLAAEYCRVVVEGFYSDEIYLTNSGFEYTVPGECMFPPKVHCQIVGYKTDNGEPTVIVKTEVFGFEVERSEIPVEAVSGDAGVFERTLEKCTSLTQTAAASADLAKASCEEAGASLQTATAAMQSALTSATAAKKSAEAAASAAEAVSGTAVNIQNLANALKGTASGEVVAIKDVSPLPHGVKVKATIPPLLLLDGYLPDNGECIADGSHCYWFPDGGVSEFTVRTKTKIPFHWGLSFATDQDENYYGGGCDDLGTEVQEDCYWYVIFANNTFHFYFYRDAEMTDLITETSITCSHPNSKVLTVESYGEDNDEVVITQSVSSVNVCGKNLFDVSKVVTLNLAAYDYKVINNGDGTITVTTATQTSTPANAPNTLRDYAPNLKVGETYYLSGSSTPVEGSSYANNYIYIGETWYFNSAKKITEAMLNSTVYWYAWGQKNATTTISNIQIEKGKTATEYEAYREPVTYALGSDGEVTVPSQYPSMTFIPDTEGVELSVEYNRDINKAFAELQAAIISMGGNV